MTDIEYRPCYVNGEKALFHRWEDKAKVIGESLVRGGHSAGQLRCVFGIVEMEGGTVAEVFPQSIRFADSTDKFAEVSRPDKVDTRGGGEG